MNASSLPRRRARIAVAALAVPLAVAALSGCQRSAQGSAPAPVAPVASTPAAAASSPATASPAATAGSGAAAAAKAAAASALSAAVKQASSAAGTVGSDLSGASSAPEGDPTQ